ncbi:MAG: tetratricopeptide repeat protein [Pseudomonadota bacterium]
MRVLKGLLGIVLLSVSPMVGAQTTADEYYQAEDWPNVEKAYSEVLDNNPTDGRAWYRLAVAQRYLKKYDAALASLEKASEVGVPASFTGYEKAKTLASSGEKDDAVSALKVAADAGLNSVSLLDAEALDGIRNEAEFANIIKTVERNAAPCTMDDHHDEFDFWLGEWEVVDANGNPQGKNVITKAENGCLMHESWTSASGNTGQSMNYYDPHSDKWYQRWVSSGALINLAGGFSDGAMRLEGDIYYYGNRNYAKFRGTWTPLSDGRVRQFFEQSTDDGESWQPWFEGYYKKIESKE